MSVVETLLIAAFALGAGWIGLVAFAGVGIRRPAAGHPRPAHDRDAALAILRELEDADGPEVDPACRTQLLRPQSPARGTLVMWHGLTNCPVQFSSLAEVMCDRGYFVLVPRLPRHGNVDLLTRDLADLTAEEIVDFAHRSVDIAAGLPGPLSVVGFSAGGSIAAWAGAVRDEVERVVLVSPLVVPKAVAVPLVRLAVRFHGMVPATWVWWNPRKKADIGGSPYMYPGFPARALVPFLQLALPLYDGRLAPSHRIHRAALVTNPGDLAVRSDAARRLMQRAYADHADSTVELTLEAAHGWQHDYIDPFGGRRAQSDHLGAIMLAALGDDEGAAEGVVAGIAPLQCVARSPRFFYAGRRADSDADRGER